MVALLRLGLIAQLLKFTSVVALKDMIKKDQGAVSIRKTVLPGMAIPMLKIRRLIFNMEIAIRR